MGDYGNFQDHADAVMALLYATPDLTVYPAEDGGPTTVPANAPPNYLSVHMVADKSLGGRLAHRSTRMRMRIYCHCVGQDDLAARAVSDLASGALLDVKPVIDGRVCYPIRSEVGSDPRDNEATGATTVTITDTYRLESDAGRDGS